MRPLWPLLLALSSAALAQTMFAVPQPPVRGQLDADAGRTLPGTPLPETIQTSPDDGGIVPEPSTTVRRGDDRGAPDDALDDRRGDVRAR